MKNLDKARLVQNILDCLAPNDLPKGIHPIGEISISFFMRDGLGLILEGEHAIAYQNALNSLLEFDDLSEKYSAKVITAEFQRLVVKIVNIYGGTPYKGDVKRELDDWLEAMEVSQECKYTYYIVIENLKTDREYTVGQVTLEPLSNELFQAIRERIHATIDANPHYSSKQKETPKVESDEHALATFRPGERDATLASTTVVSQDVNKGLEVGINYVQEVLHVLRFLGTLIYGRGMKTHIGIRGELFQGRTIYLAHSEDKGWRAHGTITGHLWPFEMTGENLAFFKENGLDTLSTILSKPSDDRTEMENRLVNAIIWISKSTFDPSEVDMLLKLCISMESLLLRRGEYPMAPTMGERLAFLLAKEYEKRVRIANHLTKKIYDLRSDIAHEGKPKKEEDLAEYLPHAIQLASQIAARMCQLVTEYGWSEFREFRDYLDELKFGGLKESNQSG